MSFDSSRFTFNPRRDFLGVVMEQGRVQLDSDWNEWQSEFARRIQAGTLDVLGPSGYPINVTPYAFQISSSTGSAGNQISIGAGRYYVDGLLAENHGAESTEAWDPAMAELSNAPYKQPFPDNTIDYMQQPYYPNPPAVGAGPYLVYLDVWQRDVTYLEDVWLIDPAVNVDTTGRLQTVWQVKLLDLSNVSGSIDCSTDVPAFDTQTQPSAARLTNGLQTNTPAGPCCLSPNTGYTGLENQLYRVEIHQGGTSPTFKWSRDNASVATSVSAIATVQVSGSNVSQLSVASLGRDSVLGFNNGNWIEIIDDYLELNNQPGELAQIASTGPGNTITLNSQLTGSYNPSDASRHTRIIRWDQASTTTGDIPVPTDGSSVALESGITVTFSPNPPSGPYYSGDFWNFAARAADASIQPLKNAPPRGIHHHYARLSIVSFSGSPTDCRVPWPPSSTNGCCCTVTVTPSDFVSGVTLQSVLDQYKNLQTLTEICLAPGTYSLPAPLRFTSAHNNITLKACQAGTAVLQAQAVQIYVARPQKSAATEQPSALESQFSDGLIVLDNVTNVTLNGLKIEVPASTFPATGNFAGLSAATLNNFDPSVASGLQSLVAGIGVRPVGSTNVTVNDCLFDLTGLENAVGDTSFPFGAGIFAAGQCSGMNIENNQFIGSTQLGSISFQAGYLHVPAVMLKTPSAPAGPPWGYVYGRNLTDTAVVDVNLSTFQDAAKTAQDIKTARTELLKNRLAITTKNPVTGVAVEEPAQGITSVGLSLTAPNLASNGGTVLAATLDNAFFKGNSFTNLNVAALLVGEPESLTFVANQITDCAAGMWSMSPLQLDYLLLLAIENLGILVALAYPLPQGDTSTLTTIPAAPASIFIYAGKSKYTDSSGNSWIPDVTKSKSFTLSGATTLNQPSPAPTINEENGSGADPDETLYQSERYAANGGSFTYTFKDLPVGFYLVTLKFAELTWTGAGERVFNVAINGATVLNDFDIFADSGGEFVADDQIFPNIVPNSSKAIEVQFTSVTNNAVISGISVVPQWNLPISQSAAGQGNVEILDFFYQVEQLAEQAYAQITWTTPQLRIQDNEMQGLVATGLMLIGDDTAMNGQYSSLMMTGNRISSNISSPGGLRVLGDLMASDATIPASIAALLGDYAFFSPVAVVQFGQCLISANMILNPSAEGLGLFVLDFAVNQPQLAVMSNLFTGLLAVIPKLYPAIDLPIAPQGCRNVLNTVIARVVK